MNLGGLYKGLTIEDIKLGSSASRNPMLINIFHHLGLVEAYGSGIPRVYESYKNSTAKPVIKEASILSTLGVILTALLTCAFCTFNS